MNGQDDDDEGRRECGETQTWRDGNVEQRESGVTRSGEDATGDWKQWQLQRGSQTLVTW